MKVKYSILLFLSTLGCTGMTKEAPDLNLRYGDKIYIQDEFHGKCTGKVISYTTDEYGHKHYIASMICKSGEKFELDYTNYMRVP